MKPNDHSLFGERLLAVRAARKLTRDDLAQKAGVSKVTIYRYESGAVEPSLGIACELATALGVLLQDLLSRPMKEPSLEEALLQVLRRQESHSGFQFDLLQTLIEREARRLAS